MGGMEINFALPLKRIVAPGNFVVQGDVQSLKFYLHRNNAEEFHIFTT